MEIIIKIHEQRNNQPLYFQKKLNKNTSTLMYTGDRGALGRLVSVQNSVSD